MKKIEIKYNGPHEILFDAPGYFGLVQKGDRIHVSEEVFKTELKTQKILGTNKNLWDRVKAEPEEKEPEIKTE